MSQFYVLQEEVPPTRRKLLYDDSVPKTILLPLDLAQLREFPRDQILREAKGFALVAGSKWGLDASKPLPEAFNFEVPESVVRHWGLREGDLVTIRVSNKVGFIADVNGERDPEKVKSLPQLQLPTYPTRPLNLGEYPTINIRALELLAPQGFGQSTYIEALGGAGKTSLLLDVIASLLHKTQNEGDKTYPIFCLLGERLVDAADYIQLFSDIPHKTGEYFLASREEKPDAVIETLKFVRRRASRLTQLGYDVVLVIDSLSRAADAYSGSSLVNPGGGMVSGGMYREAVTFLVSLMEGAGDYPKAGSLSTISTVLAPDRDGPAEGGFARETSRSQTTSRVELGLFPGDWPHIIVSETNTFTRKRRRFVSAQAMEEMIYTVDLIWDRDSQGVSHHAVDEASKVFQNFIRRVPWAKWLLPIQSSQQAKLFADLLLTAHELELRPEQLIIAGAKFVEQLGKSGVLYTSSDGFSQESKSVETHNPPMIEPNIELPYLWKQHLPTSALQSLNDCALVRGINLEQAAYFAVYMALIAIKALRSGRQLAVEYAFGVQAYEFPIPIEGTTGRQKKGASWESPDPDDE